jgi:hypothetical protein
MLIRRPKKPFSIRKGLPLLLHKVFIMKCVTFWEAYTNDPVLSRGQKKLGYGAGARSTTSGRGEISSLKRGRGQEKCASRQIRAAGSSPEREKRHDEERGFNEKRPEEISGRHRQPLRFDSNIPGDPVITTDFRRRSRRSFCSSCTDLS